MKNILLGILFIISVIVLAKNKFPEDKNRFSFTGGIGPSYSIWNDKLVVDGVDDSIFVGLTTIKRKNSIGMNIFGEFSCLFRQDFYLSIGLDYNQFNRKFLPEEKFVSPYHQEEIALFYSGDLTDRNTTIQFTMNKRVYFKNQAFHFGAGIFFMFTKEPAIYIGFQPPPYQTSFVVSNGKNQTEFGFPFQLMYEYNINKKWSIGLKTQYQYVLSTRNSQNMYFSSYFRLNIEGKNKKLP